MSDLETLFFVRAVARFLHQQIEANRFSVEVTESLEVAVQCLETAFELPTSGESDLTLGTSHPLAQIDIFELFRGACPTSGGVSAERRSEADAVKNEGNGLMKEEKFHEALQAYSRWVES